MLVTIVSQPVPKVLYSKMADKVPYTEQPSCASVDKDIKVDQFEWNYLPENSIAAAALGDGEVDWWEAPSPDLVPMLAANPEIAVEKTDPLGSTTMLRFNQLHPPFDNIKMRQAVLAVTDQPECMTPLAGARTNLC